MRLVGLWVLLAWFQLGLAQQGKLREAIKLPYHFYHLNRPKVLPLALERWQYGPDARQYFLLTYPKARPKGAVFFLHGGAWRMGRAEQHLPLATWLNEQGYLVVLASYRLSGQTNALEMKHDVLRAFVAAEQHLRSRSWADLTWVIGGTSAGANLAALLCFDREALAVWGLSQGRFAGFFALAGALDLDYLPLTRPLQRFAGPKTGALFQQLNPINYLRSDEVLPVWLLHGQRDGLVPYTSAWSFAQRLKYIRPDLLTWHLLEAETHLSIGTQWYYQTRRDCGQLDLLGSWLATCFAGH